MTEYKNYDTFQDFYPFYLSNHSNQSNRRFHFVGVIFSIITIMLAIINSQTTYLLGIPLFGYGLAWVGHFCFERNIPLVLKYPLYSFYGDVRLFFDILTGKKAF